jgi:hypothetical protein
LLAAASCTTSCCCCCCCFGAPASSLHAFSTAAACPGCGWLPKSGAMPNLSMSVPRGVRYLPTVITSPELSLSS